MINLIIPKFCYHNNLSVSGNCRMCLVELDNAVNPVVSCCTLINNDMVVYTDSTLIRISREYILEFLLINHPLDCPICDQAGECDLQDLTLIYGSDHSKFSYTKKSILNKQVGPFIKTQMNRCIYCTRCVRYTHELNNTYSFNTLGRSVFSEIGNYYYNTVMSISYVHGNVIDLCPVGALTSKPNTFRTRAWEFISIDSIDILDSFCSNIRLDIRNNVVERILPKYNNNLNEEWISDKIRFCYDGFKKQRLCLPLYKKNAKHIIVSWFIVLHKIKKMYYKYYTLSYNNSFLNIYTGHLTDIYTLNLLKKASNIFGFTNINLNININIDLKKYFIFNTTITNFYLNNVYLILGTNTKIDSPILNMRIKHLKYKLNKKIKIGYIGSRILINYSLSHIGLTNTSIYSILNGKSFFCKIIKKSYNLICLFSHGINSLNNSLFFSLFNNLSYNLKTQYFICNTLSLFSNDINISELGILSYYYNKSKYIIRKNASILYLLGVDFSNFRCFNSFVIYQGHHGDIGVFYADLILPSSLYIENTSFFFNCEGKFLTSNIAINKMEKIKNDSNILYNLFIMLFKIKFIFYINLISSFFYKLSYFFKKGKFNIPFFINNSRNVYWLTKDIMTIKNIFLKMDVFSRSSYYLSKTILKTFSNVF